MKKFITAKFNGKCAETGFIIKKGQTMLYDYDSKKCYCSSSNEYKNHNSPDPAAGMIQANEDAFFDNFCQSNNI